MHIAEYFSTRPIFERTVFDAVLARLETLGPMQIGNRLVHVVNLNDPAEVDDRVREWLSESYADFG